MTKIIKRQSAPTTTLSMVKAQTIRQLRHHNQDTEYLYSRLADQNNELALWLRARTAELAPELEDREPVARLALELATLISNQETIYDLTGKFGAY